MVIFSRMHAQVAGVSEMVAPGVAQALITTIGGLIVAIPALFFYNYFTMILRNLANEAENYASRIIYLK
jgi:biopolymer transport protein ExbB/TolQ